MAWTNTKPEKQMAYSRKAAVLPGFYRGKHSAEAGMLCFRHKTKHPPLYDRHPCHLLSSIVSFIRNSVCGQLGSSSLLSIEKGRIRLWTRPHISVILILSVLYMFHFFSLFLPIFGKFKARPRTLSKDSCSLFNKTLTISERFSLCHTF